MAEMMDWFRDHATQLTTVDPDAELDDLEPLRELVSDARVVAVGEGAHFVEEFGYARARILRYLVERCGFSVLLAEYGFAAGFPTDAWLHTAGTRDDLVDIGGALATGINGMVLRWVRDYNSSATRAVDFGGVDLPINASLLPVLDPVQDFLVDADPDSLPLLSRARELAESIGGGSAVIASANWSELVEQDQNELTATLSKLALRVHALEPILTDSADHDSYDLVVRHIDAARRLDYMYSVMAGVFGGKDIPGDSSIRDRYMADSVHWHLDRVGAGTKVVLMTHNMHIQKTPVRHGGHFAALPMGYYLARELGEHYTAIALTHTAATVPEMDVAASGNSDAVGFTVVDAKLDPPAPGSIEAELVGAGLGDAITLTNVRQLPRQIPHIRGQSATTQAPMPTAFDAVASTPTATVDPTLPF